MEMDPMDHFSNWDIDQKQSQGGDKRCTNEVKVEGNTDLSRDLVIEILCRLPVKILCKFRCVSKEWLYLLTRDEEFISRHIKWSKVNPRLLIRKYISDENGEVSKSKAAIELTSVDLEGNIIDKFRKVVDGLMNTFISCGRLSILCCMYSLYVCNPSFHEVVRVPCRSHTKSSKNIGFGYLPSSSEYKIVHFYDMPFRVDRDSMGCEVFSFRDGEDISAVSWRRIVDCPCSICGDNYPLCVSGVIYWALTSEWNRKSILSFDLATEEFGIINYPTPDSKRYNLMESTGIGGFLFVVGCSETTMDLWMLKDKSKKVWVMEHSISLFPLVPSFLISSDSCTEEILIHTEQKGLVSYSTRNQSSRRIKYLEAVRSFNKPCLYHHSLFPLHM